MERGRPRAHRHRRARPRAGRRRGARLARADRRRSGHRQEHAAAPGGPGAGAGGAAGALRVGRGVGGPGEDARRPARHRAATGCCCGPRTICRRCRPSSTTIKPRALVDRLDPDGVPAGARVGAGQRGPGARVRRPPDDAGQGPRHRHVPGGPRHQGGRARRAARARAPGRHRALLRGRAPSRLPRAARGEEPLRLHQRDRRLRDGRAAGWSRCRTPPASSSPSGRPTRRARSSSRRWRARGRCCSSCRRSCRAPRSARRGAPCSAPTTTASACCWRCWRSARACRIGNQDVFVNVAGGGRVVEPAADLGIVIAAASSYLERPVPRRRPGARRGRAHRRGAGGQRRRGAPAGGRPARLQVGDRPAQQRRRVRCRCRSRAVATVERRARSAARVMRRSSSPGWLPWSRAARWPAPRWRPRSAARPLAGGARRRALAGARRDRGRGRPRRGAAAAAACGRRGRRRGRPAGRASRSAPRSRRWPGGAGPAGAGAVSPLLGAWVGGVVAARRAGELPAASTPAGVERDERARHLGASSTVASPTSRTPASWTGALIVPRIRRPRAADAGRRQRPRPPQPRRAAASTCWSGCGGARQCRS